MLLQGPSQTCMQRIQIRPLTGAVNLPLNIAALGLKEMEGAQESGKREHTQGGSNVESEQRDR